MPKETPEERYIWKTANGRRRVRVRIGDKVRTGTFDTIAEARRRVIELLDERDGMSKTRLSLKGFIEQQYKRYAELRGNTETTTETIKNRLHAIEIGYVDLLRMPITDIDEVDIMKADRQFENTPGSRTRRLPSAMYANMVKGELYRILKYAHAKGVISSDPTVDLRKLNKKPRPRPREFVPADEHVKILRRMHNYLYFGEELFDEKFDEIKNRNVIAIEIAYFTGMRPGEIFALMWDDFNNDMTHVYVHAHLSLVEGYVDRIKNGRSRIVGINDLLKDHLQRWKLRTQHRGPFVLNSPQGGPYTPTHMSRVINQFAKDSFGYTLSMFRKLNASFLHQSGVELEDRSTILGQTPDVHKRHYDVDDVERILKESIEHQNRLLQEIDRKEFGVG